MPRSRRKLIVPILIVLFWATMVAQLMNREVFVDRAAPGTSGYRADSDTWMGIYVAGAEGEEHKIGYVHTLTRRERRDDVQGTSIAVNVKFATSLLSIPTEISVDSDAWVEDDLGLRDFDVQVSSQGDHGMRATGRIADDQLQLTIETGGESFPLNIPVGKDVLLAGGMGTTTFNLPSLEVGEEVLIDAFDPMTLSAGQARVKCVATETLTIDSKPVFTKVITTTLSGITTKFWVTLAEDVVRVETPFGFVLRKVNAMEALSSGDPQAAHELMNTMAIRPTGKKPFRGARRMTVRFSGLPPGISPPTDSIQLLVEEGVYRITVPELPDGGESDSIEELDLNEFLTGDPFVQVGHPDIVALVAEVITPTDAAWDKADDLFAWVYENIEKTIVLSFPSALDVLSSREGDCNEHTVLFAAMARTAGIPTRIAIGVVWSDELNGFYYHAWPEVYTGRWIAIDPTLGQPVADATHLKLLTGNIESWPRLVPYMGRLKLEILEIE